MLESRIIGLVVSNGVLDILNLNELAPFRLNLMKIVQRLLMYDIKD